MGSSRLHPQPDKMKEKKAQLKMMESILVLVIFFFLLAFGLAFYAGFSKTSEKKKDQESVELDVMEIAQRVQYMPELQCTKDGTTVVADCFDIIKVRAFREMANNTRYQKLLPNVYIAIEQIYPEDYNTTDMVIADNMPQTSRKLSLESFHLPITIFDPIEGTYSFGYTTIGVYY